MSYTIGKGKPPKRTQFKKGQSGNPEGARRHNQDFKALKKVLKADLVEKLLPMLDGTLSDLSRILKNKKSSSLEIAFASVLLKAIKKGDWKSFNGMVEFLVGKDEPTVRRKESPPERTYVVKKVLL